jgi:predicted methyltransferase
MPSVCAAGKGKEGSRQQETCGGSGQTGVDATVRGWENVAKVEIHVS